jgi:Flp pilus assembly protein TadG
VYQRNRKSYRSGAVVPLFALMLIPLLGMLAFSIDAGYMALVKSDLQNAADAAALAGAEKLQQLYVQYYQPGQTSQTSIFINATTNSGPHSPMATAELFAGYNKAGNVSLSVPDSDVNFGFTNAQGYYFTSYAGFPNTIEVVVRRDSVANTPLKLFFGGLLGMPSINMTATARATIYSGPVTSLQAIAGVGAHILPVALDYKVWDQFYQTGVSPDGIIHLNASNQVPELQVYPYAGDAPGNFALLDVGPPQNNAPAFRNWIDYGETPNDISYLLNTGLLPVSMQGPESWKGGPGLKSTLVSDFASQEGVPNLIPLFKAVQYPSPANNNTYIAAASQGQNATYSIVGFVGVDISRATSTGLSNMVIAIQPMAVVDPSAVIPGATPAGTQSSPMTPSVPTYTTTTTFTSAKLTY